MLKKHKFDCLNTMETPNPGLGSVLIQLTRLNKPVGIFLVMWPGLWALWLASNGLPSPTLICIFIIGSIVMRSAGCVINDFADRNIDGDVERTRDRPLATGLLPPTMALGVFAALILIALGLALWLNMLAPNTLALKMAALAAGLAVIYPFTKRFTAIPQVFLGAAFACSVPMAFAAETGAIPASAWLIYMTVVLWTVTYDTFYAMVDREDDLKIGVKSTAILFGEHDLLMTRVMQVLTLIALIGIGQRFHLGIIYYIGLIGASFLFAYQQWIIFDRNRQACLTAFKNNNFVGLIIFLGIAGDYLLKILLLFLLGPDTVS